MVEASIIRAREDGRAWAQQLAKGVDNVTLVDLIRFARVGVRGARSSAVSRQEQAKWRALLFELERIAFVRTALAVTKAAAE